MSCHDSYAVEDAVFTDHVRNMTFGIGSRVRVINKSFLTFDCVGIIVGFNPSPDGAARVQLEGQTYQKGKFSQYKLYNLVLEPMSKFNEIEQTGGRNLNAEKFKVATVKFVNDKSDNATSRCSVPAQAPYYCALYDENAKVGDLCIVKTHSHGFALANISGIRDQTEGDLASRSYSMYLCREVVSLVDFSAYTARCANRERIADLQKKMQERSVDFQKNAFFEYMAAQDGEFKTLYDEYKSLTTPK